jgi:hypothetical protein
LTVRTLSKARGWTLGAAAVLAVALGVAVSPRFGAGVLVAAVWATAWLWLIEALTRRAVVPAGTPRPIGAITVLAAAKVLLYGLAVWALLAKAFPVTSYLVGFTLMLLAMSAVTIARRAGGSRAPAGPGRGGEG